MKSLLFKTITAGLFILVTFVGQTTFAQNVDSYYSVGSAAPYYGSTYGQNYSYPVISEPEYNYNYNTDYINQLLELVAQLQAQLAAQNSYVDSNNYYPQYLGNNGYTFTNTSGSNYSSSDNDDEPDVDTKSARDIQDDSAELRGEVDMNDFNNGIVFFVYGQDESKIEDVERDYDEYSDVNNDEEDDDFEVVKVDSDLDGDDTYEEEVSGLEDDEEYFFVICVEYEDEDNDETLECGDLEDFDTDDNGSSSNDEEPDVETDSAGDIEDNSAELRGSVDMNDFDNGIVFFVWGEDEDDIDDVDDEDSYSDINEDGDDIQKDIVDSNFDGDDNFELDVYGLDDNTDHHFRICVQYDNEDNDETLECGNVKEFETEN